MLSDLLQTELCSAALEMAMQNGEVPKLIHHDQGSQYVSAASRKLVAEHGSILNMSRKGNCWDNAISESFFDKLKKEADDTFADIHDARRIDSQPQPQRPRHVSQNTFNRSRLNNAARPPVSLKWHSANSDITKR